MLRTIVLLMASAVFISGRASAAEDAGLLAQMRPGTESVDRPSAQPLAPPGFLPQKPAEVFALPPLPVEPPSQAPASGPGMVIRSYVFEGNTVFSDAELQGMAAPFAGRIVTASELEDLRQKLTRAYIERG